MWYVTLSGGALGADQAEALKAEVLLHLDLMREFDHRRDKPPRALTRIEHKTLHRVQCDFRVTWHAGRALELALHAVYAVANNKILGRRYPKADPKQVGDERSDRHSVTSLYEKLIASRSNTHPDLDQVLEHLYREAFHRGFEDVLVDDEWRLRFITEPDIPFCVTSVQQYGHGREVTIDHSVGHFYNLSDVTMNFPNMPPRFQEKMGEDIRRFWELPDDTFSNFLAKADKAYFGKRPMRWADYWWRDHEDFRPYIRVGSSFFDRLVENLINVAQETWIMEESYFERQMERISRYNRDFGKTMIEDWSEGPVSLPEAKGNNEHLRRHLYPDPAKWDYGILHKNNAVKRAAIGDDARD